MSDLAAHLRVDPSTVTRTLQRMEAADLAKRVPDDDDGRVVKVRLTEEGRRLHGIVAGRRAEIINAVFQRFAAADREQLVELLERFIKSVDAYVADRGAEPPAVSPG
jgi:DNA-binding MarR family transcriptional regulator